MFPAFTIFGKTIGTYAICAVVGLVVCGFVLSAIGKKKGISWMDILLAIVGIGIGLTIGGHLLYGITQYNLVFEAFQMIGRDSFVNVFLAFANAFGGSVFYGGFLGGLAGLAIVLKIEKNLNKKDFFDLYGLGIPLFHTFGRIGCFFGGCCYGVESSFGFIVEHNEYSAGLEGVRRFPLQLLEALLNLILFFVLLAIYRHFNKQSENKNAGRILFLYMVTYPVYRFILEFFRGDEIRGHWFGLSTSQWISIFLFIAGIIGNVILSVRSGKASSGTPSHEFRQTAR